MDLIREIRHHGILFQSEHGLQGSQGHLNRPGTSNIDKPQLDETSQHHKSSRLLASERTVHGCSVPSHWVVFHEWTSTLGTLSSYPVNSSARNLVTKYRSRAGHITIRMKPMNTYLELVERAKRNSNKRSWPCKTTYAWKQEKVRTYNNISGALRIPGTSLRTYGRMWEI